MPSPDVSPYLDLALDDRDAGSLLDEALDLAGTLLPDWSPREGQTESLLLELLALQASEVIFALNRIPASVVEVLIKVFGVQRDDGAAATTTLQFTVNDLLGHVIPAGTRVSLDLGEAVAPVLFATDVALAIPAGQTTGQVSATANQAGSGPNGAAAGVPVALVDAVAAVNAVATAAPVGGGRDLEPDATYFARALLAFTRLTSTLLRAADFEAYALAQPYVFRAKAIDLYNPTSGNAPGADVGHITVAVIGATGVPVSGANKAALAAAMLVGCSAGLTVHIIDATITAVAVTATVRRFAAYTAAAVTAAVTADLQAYLSPDTWEWSGTVRYNELIALLDRSAGVDFVVSITVPAGDVQLLGYATLVTAGAIALTVQDPV